MEPREARGIKHLIGSAPNAKRLTISIPQFAQQACISKDLAYRLAREDRLPVPVIHLGAKRMVLSRRAVMRLFSDGQPGEEG